MAGTSGNKPDRDYLEALRLTLYGVDGRLPDVLWDGFVSETRDNAPVLCVKNGESLVLNIDAKNEFKNPSSVMTKHDCELPKLPGVVLAGS